MAGRELVSERKGLVWMFRTQLDWILSAVKSCCVVLCHVVLLCSVVLCHVVLLCSVVSCCVVM